MKTLVSYILESFNDSVLKEYFAYANKLDGETKRLLTGPILKTSTGIDLHNVKAEEQHFGKDYNVASIKKYFNDIVSKSEQLTSNGYSYANTVNVFIIKMQKDDVTVFGLVAPIYQYGASKLKDLKIILPDDMETPENYVEYALSDSCSKLSKAIRNGWKITVFRYKGDGNNDLSDLYKLRQERKANQKGVFDNSEEFLSFYKGQQLRKRLSTMIRNASKHVEPDYQSMLDEAKEELNKLFKFVDITDRAMKGAGYRGIKKNDDLNKALERIDKNVMDTAEMLNKPDFYTSSIDKLNFQSLIDNIKDSIDSAYRLLEFLSQDNID